MIAEGIIALSFLQTDLGTATFKKHSGDAAFFKTEISLFSLLN